ncbi:MAG: ribonuclease H-like domain-containing protein [Syntrophobacteraceae bacterium]|nr:ribonuclease H-like domain-containing protein [Syntrophobacteraceae bacterium]
MLKNTFCHLPGIGIQTERKLWSSGITSWEHLLAASASDVPMSLGRLRLALLHLEESFVQFDQRKPLHFQQSLPFDQHWRLFADFRDLAVFLDIETTGMGGPWDHLTTISLYDGRSISCYVHDDNLLQFREDIERYGLVITYNGKTFDLPFIRQTLRSPMNHAHIDLRYVLRSLGYRGGLKGCEKQLGIAREDLDGVDGLFAVHLWREYLRTWDRKVLDTLLAYNVLDVVNLEPLMVQAYNARLSETPFADQHFLCAPTRPDLPYLPDQGTIERVRHAIMTTFWH